MDRTMYGKVLPGTYYPFRCAMKENGISPGYALLADLQNSINPGRVSSPVGRTSSPGGRTSSPGRTGSPLGRGSSPGRLSSPGGSLSSPTSTGYGSINGSRNIGSDYAKPSSPTYQNTTTIHEKIAPAKFTTSYGHSPGYTTQSPGYNNQSPGFNNQSTGYTTRTEYTSHSPGNSNQGTTRTEYTSQSPGYTSQSPGYTSQSPGYGRTTGRGNLSELDTLLDDLSNARYGNYVEKNTYTDRSDGYSRTNGATSPASTRPTVDSLLDQLSTDIPNGRATSISPVPPASNAGTLPRPGTKQVTVTVQETVVEPAQQPLPPPPAAVVTTVRQHHASSATKELDDLMASLSDFKVSGVGAAPGGESGIHVHREKRAWQEHYRSNPRQPESASLEHMLGSLRADMSRQGVQTPQKGCCNACEKPIVGQVITALGRTWHPEHFTCAHCNQELGTRNFFERDGRPYCEPDYHNLFSPRCAYCNGPILDKCVTALEKTWHTEHFFCAQCGQQFGEDGFHERDGKPYCRADYFDMFAPKCGGCNKPIMENYISALNTQWHPDCFVCKECREPFHGGSFFEHEGQPYCETHYHGKRGSLCAGCHKPIAGRCITAMFRKFHPEHFVCAFCLRQLNKGTFKEQNDKPYCHACFDKLFG
ncbi:leupaxin isoform X3 [Maniola hyperantus]|uniref:leupaxin isoform X3 n=1 Tax=Aphantopus hyperantus TaxID=2795564 RepID=UPI001569140A|nr:paxillin isoform X3 [Maniola hyperantus]